MIPLKQRLQLRRVQDHLYSVWTYPDPSKFIIKILATFVCGLLTLLVLVVLILFGQGIAQNVSWDVVRDWTIFFLLCMVMGFPVYKLMVYLLRNS